MRIRISFARKLTLGAIDGAAEYYEVVESELRAAEAKARESIDSRVKSMGLEPEDEFVEWDLAMQQQEIAFRMLYPNYLRYSYLVLLYLVVENKLWELHEVARSRENGRSLTQPGPKCSIIRWYQKWLKQPPAKTVQPRPTRDIIRWHKGWFKRHLAEDTMVHGLRWDDLLDLNKVRNCVVHASGKVSGLQYEKRIRDIAQKGIGVSISGDRPCRDDRLEPLYLEDDTLMIEPAYCRRVTTVVRDFFGGLCDALALPKITMTNGPIR